MLELEVVLPCYNEGKSLCELLHRSVSAAEEAKFSPGAVLFVLVNNGSTDDSELALAKLQQDSRLNPWFRVVHVLKNEGYGNGVWQGLKSASAPYVGWSHADLQCDPKDVLRAYLLLKEKDARTLVKGRRYGRGLKERMISFIFASVVFFYLRRYITEINAQPKVFSRNLLQHLTEPPKDFAFDIYVLWQALRQGYSFVEIPVHFPPRKHGLSHWAATVRSRRKTFIAMIHYIRKLSRVSRV